MRSVFSAGLLDEFLRADFKPFDLLIGVSGGACNLLSYLAGMEGKSLELYQRVAEHPGFISYNRFLRGGDLLDIDWLITYVFSQAADLPARLPQDKCFLITATNVHSGEAAFIQANQDNLRAALKASISLPLLCREFTLLNDMPHTDGGVAANIPVQEALRRGVRRLMVVRSRPSSFNKKDTLVHRYIRWMHRQYPALRQKMQQRVELHQQTVSLLQSPPPGIEIIDLCPPEHFSAGRFCRDLQVLQQGYEAGRKVALQAMQQW